MVSQTLSPREGQQSVPAGKRVGVGILEPCVSGKREDLTIIRTHEFLAPSLSSSSYSIVERLAAGQESQLPGTFEGRLMGAIYWARSMLCYSSRVLRGRSFVTRSSSPKSLQKLPKMA